MTEMNNTVCATRMVSFDRLEIDQKKYNSLMLGEMISIGNSLGIVSGIDTERITVQLVGSEKDPKSLPVKLERINEIRELEGDVLSRITSEGFSYFRYLTRFEGLPDILASHCQYLSMRCGITTGKTAATAAVNVLIRQQGQSALESFAYSVNSLFGGSYE